MKIVWLASIYDRHADPRHRVFACREKAVAWVLEEFRECLAQPDCITVEDFEDDCWLASYDLESDHASVVWTELVE